MLHIIEREIQWRKDQGKPEGFGTLRANKPVIAIGAEEPLDDQKMLADYFRECPFFDCRVATRFYLFVSFIQTEKMVSGASTPV
jgi:hypothetical protein